MSDLLETKPAGVKRVVFKEIAAGDLRKFKAKANDAESGGGARDLRFPYKKFVKIFRALFPSVRHEKRKRDKPNETVEVLVGRLHWSLNGKEGSKEVTFEPPTNVRPTEGRIPVVHTYPPFNQLPPTNEGRIVLLFVQRDDDTVWPEFATEDALRSNKWNEAITRVILASLDAKRGAKLARGYKDFVDGSEYSGA